MKKLILITLLFVVFSWELTAGKPVRPLHSYKDYYKFVQDVKKTIVIEHSYKVGTEKNLVLAPGRAALLDFEDNPAEVKEFIFFYNDEDETVHLIYRYTNDTKKEYQGTRLYSEQPKSYRGTRATGATTWLWLFYEFESKDGNGTEKSRNRVNEPLPLC